jgi:hypothetical protein
MFCANLSSTYFKSLLSSMVPKIQMFVITSRAADPEMEFLDINLTKDSSLSLHAIHSPFYWKISKQQFSPLVLIILKKIHEITKLKSIHE